MIFCKKNFNKFLLILNILYPKPFKRNLKKYNFKIKLYILKKYFKKLEYITLLTNKKLILDTFSILINPYKFKLIFILPNFPFINKLSKLIKKI